MKLIPNTDFRADIGTHVWVFKAGEPKEVPDVLAEQVKAQYGAFFGKRDSVKNPEKKPRAHEDVEAAVLEAVKSLFNEGDPKDFTRGGKPKLSAVKALLVEPAKSRVNGTMVDAAVDIILAQG